jgi:hypothetical protein
MMKHLIALLFLAGCSDISSSSVVKVTVGMDAQCTGFFVDSDRIMTSAHCFNDSTDDITVEYVNDLGEIDSIEGVLELAQESDMGHATILVDLDGPALEWGNAPMGAPVHQWGWIGENALSNKGFVTARLLGKYWSTVYTEPGYSGGPLIFNGKVVAVHQATPSPCVSLAVKPDSV